MERVLRQKVVIGPDGDFHGKAPGLPPGTEAEVILLPIIPPVAGEVDRKVLVEKLREMSDEAIRNGMETWDIDRINAEIAERRYGDREYYR